MKKAAKKRGYQYNNVFSGTYCLTKKIDNGPVICLGVDSGPSHFSVDFFISLQGIGYDHRLFYSMQTPTDQGSFESCSEKFFSVVDDFENQYYRNVKELFPSVPDWFVANLF